MQNVRRWIPAFAGMTIFKPTAFQTSSPACDDCCVGGPQAIRIPNSLPAKAGIQRLSVSTQAASSLSSHHQAPAHFIDELI
jgi:hypothetical protein